MAKAIGIRIYRLEVTRRGSREHVTFKSDLLAEEPKKFVRQFVADRATPTRDDDIERTWFFEPKSSKKDELKGYINYGTFGFESNLVDSKTKKNNYRRRTTDVEEIPLFYCF